MRTVPRSDREAGFCAAVDEPPRLTLADSIGCECARKADGGCVDDLSLLPLLGFYRHADGRAGTFLGRRRHGDPLTGRVAFTIVAFRGVDATGRIVRWALLCAGPPTSESRYEAVRESRPPESVRQRQARH